MKAKEKALKLVENFYNIQGSIDWGDEDSRKEAGIIYENNKVDYEQFYRNLAKQSAIIAVDEILETYKQSLNLSSEYWQEVKNEIEKL